MLGVALGAVVATAAGVGVAVAHQSGSHDRSREIARAGRRLGTARRST